MHKDERHSNVELLNSTWPFKWYKNRNKREGDSWSNETDMSSIMNTIILLIFIRVLIAKLDSHAFSQERT